MTEQEKRIINNILMSNHLAKKLAKSAFDTLDKSGVEFDMTNKRDASIMKYVYDVGRILNNLFVDDFDKILHRVNKKGDNDDNRQDRA